VYGSPLHAVRRWRRAFSRLDGGGSDSFADDASNEGQNAVEFVFHVFRSNADDPDALGSEPAGALLITCDPVRIIMNTSVHFDGQPCGRAVEIENVRAERVLTPKLEAVQTMSADADPQAYFRRRHWPPESPSALVRNGLSHALKSCMLAAPLQPTPTGVRPTQPSSLHRRWGGGPRAAWWGVTSGWPRTAGSARRLLPAPLRSSRS
jgi:hypothetical protein